jgi:hypothetical protein
MPYKTLQEERRVQQRKERPNPPHTQQQGNKGPVSKTTNETKKQNV